MAAFIAHYSSASASADRAKGSFSFESESRLGSKANGHDARVRMLELYGNDALSWTIDSIEHKSASGAKATADGQLEMDFRTSPTRQTSNRRRVTKRGLI